MRNVFFSFHYEDIFRVNVVRNSHIVRGVSAAGFRDASLWEEAKLKGERAIKALIDRKLHGTTVTCVLIGKQTHAREYVEYEINQSLKRGNGLLGIHINGIRNLNRETDWFRGTVPEALQGTGAKIYDWDPKQFGDWVADAYDAARSPAPRPKSFFEALNEFFD